MCYKFSIMKGTKWVARDIGTSASSMTEERAVLLLVHLLAELVSIVQAHISCVVISRRLCGISWSELMESAQSASISKPHQRGYHWCDRDLSGMVCGNVCEYE